MARSFSDREKELIRSSLIEEGRAFFAKYGLKGTGIGDLTQAAGISQGSFYVFFHSKEELYFEILEMEEEKLAATLRNLFYSEKLTKKSLKNFMSRYVELVHENPLIENLIERKEYELLMRKLPESKRQKHLQNEVYVFSNITSPLLKEGRLRQVKPEVLSGLFHALFLLHLHKKEIGEEIFPQIMELMMDLLSEGLVIREEPIGHTGH